MSRACRRAYGKDLDPGDGSYRVIDNRPEAEKWVRDRVGKTVISIDIEGDKSPSVHPSLHNVLCLGLDDGKETVILPEDLFSSLWPSLADLLDDASIVAHHGKFDCSILGWVLRGRNDPIELDHDTMMAHYALWPAGGDDGEHAGSKVATRAYHGLKLLGDLYLGCGDWSLTQAEYEDMRSVPLPRLYTYNAKDVQRTRILLHLFRDQFNHKKRQITCYKTVLMPTTNLFAWSQDTGVTVNVDYLKQEVIPDMESSINDIKRSVVKIASDVMPNQSWPSVNPSKRFPGETREESYRFNPGSPNQVRMILEHQGVKLPVNRKSRSKKGSTDARTLTRLLKTSRKGDPFLTELLRFRQEDKILGTYAAPLAYRHAHTEHPYSGTRAFPQYHLHKTLTGRTASDDPNIQNQPDVPAIKKCYVASGPGRVVTQSDYGQAELRVMASVGDDQYLKSFFWRQFEEKKTLKKGEKGMDFFDDLLPSVFSNVDFDANPEMRVKLRRPLKTVVYGVSYDRGPRDIADALGIKVKEASAILKGYLNTVSGVNAWRNEVIDTISRGGTLRTRFGRYLLTERVTEDNLHDIRRRALSFIPQSCASDCCLLAAVKLGKYIRKNKLSWEISAMIHDAIYTDVPEDEADDALAITEKFMLESAEEWFPDVPFAVDGKKGKSWADFKG